MITNGFKNLMKQVLSSGGTSQGLLPITDVSGTTRYLADYTAYPYTVTTNFATTAAGAGISVGSGNAASTENTYQLANTITSGLSGTVTVSKTVDVNNNSTIELELYLSNTSGSDITIAEIGYKQEFSASTTQSGTSTDDYVFLIDRTVLSSPATVTAGGSAVITYSLTTKLGASSGVQDVEVDGVSVVTGGVAEIDLTGKQDTLIAGTNITIAADGKTISASGGTTVVANPSGTATGDLNSVQIGSTIYDIPSSGGGTTVIPNPVGTPTDDLDTIQIGNTIYDIVCGGGYVYMSDYYDTTERVVGRWTDGKPLYQKTWDLGSNVSIPNNSWYTSNIPKDGIERIISAKCAIYDANGGGAYGLNAICYESNVAYVRFCASRSSGAITARYITLQYTKTTDAPGTGPTTGNLIYLPALYSEEEREVGVWTDGKPLYQKTHKNLSLSIPANTWTNTGIPFTNIDTYKVLYNKSENQGADSQYPMLYRFDNGNFQVFCQWAMPLDELTLQYTKTTDTPGSGTWTPEGQYSHVYSTNPYIVGKWIDGSAIWECTYDFGSDVTVSTNWSATTIPNTDMDMCIRCEAMSSYGTNKPNIEADLKDSGGYVKLAADGVSNNVRYLTLQYTMST